jgi:lipopolysaccharide export LptBFGC system permease protein LptF
MKKRIYEILIYIFGTIYICSFFWLFFISGEFGIISFKISISIFTCSMIICYVLACILVKKEFKENEK